MAAEALQQTVQALLQGQLERLQIRRELANAVNNRIQLGWNGSQYQLERDLSYSGLPRFEDGASGLAWITIVGQSFLLDTKKGVRVAGACNL